MVIAIATIWIFHVHHFPTSQYNLNRPDLFPSVDDGPTIPQLQPQKTAWYQRATQQSLLQALSLASDSLGMVP